MTSATPKPRAGEHTPETERNIYRVYNADSGPITASAIPSNPQPWDAVSADFARKLEAERDLLRERERELVEVLENVLRTGDPYQRGLADRAARAVLAKVKP